MKPTLEDAIILAAQNHRGQTDKAGAPYILHPLRVMASLGRKASESERIGANRSESERIGANRSESERIGANRSESPPSVL